MYTIFCIALTITLKIVYMLNKYNKYNKPITNQYNNAYFMEIV